MAYRLTTSGVRYIAQRFGLFATFGILLFLSAGSWTWFRGWLYLLATGAVEVATLLVLVVRSPEMVNQRGAGHADIKSFDKVFAGLWLLLGMGSAVTAGLDAVRFGASRLPWSTFAVGLVILLPASALGGWAMVENEHFEQFVRVQEERGHRVVSTGPYAMVRHPGYLAAILGGFATPLMLGSLWTFVPVGILGVSFVVRTFFEDRTLQEELEGYSQYTRRTRYRLVPWLW